MYIIYSKKYKIAAESTGNFLNLMNDFQMSVDRSMHFPQMGE